MVDEIARAMKSCFAGLYLDGFDFIQGLALGFHLNKVKISSLPCNDFIKPTEKEETFRLETDLFPLSVYIGVPRSENMSFGVHVYGFGLSPFTFD